MQPLIKIYNRPARKKTLEETAVSESTREDLYQILKDYLESPTKFKKIIEEVHFGKQSTYSHKPKIMEGLHAIYQHLKMNEPSADAKRMIAMKLEHYAANFPVEFHNGVNALVELLDAPEDINELLSQVRHETVSRVANQTQEVNTKEVYNIASKTYGVYPINPDDIYRSSLDFNKVKNSLKVTDSLKKAFDEDMRFPAVFYALEQQLRAVLLIAGYQGFQSEGIDTTAQLRMEDVLNKLFFNHPKGSAKLDVFKRKEDKIITDLNWNSIRQMLWEAIKQQQYYDYSAEEEKRINQLLNPDISLEEKQHIANQLIDNEDVLTALQYYRLFKTFQIEIDVADNISQKIRLVFENTPNEEPLALLKQLPRYDFFIQADDALAVIKKRQNLSDMLRCIDSEQLTLVLNACETQLPELIQDGLQLGRVLRNLNEKQCTVVLKAFETQLPKIITDGKQLAEALLMLHEPQRTVVFKAFETQLPGLIKDGLQLAAVLENLNETQRTVVFKAFETQLPGLIKDGLQLAYVLKNLNETQRTDVFKAFETELPGLINSSHELIALLENLNETHCTLVLKALETQLPKLFQDNLSLISAGILDETQYTLFLKAIETQLPKLIRNGYELASELKNLQEAQRTLLLKTLETQLPGLIKDRLQLAYVLTLSKTSYDEFTPVPPLNETQCTLVLKALETQLPELIPNVYQLVDLVEKLNEEQRTIVLEALETQFPKLIRDGSQLAGLVEKLNEEQRTIVLEALEKQLPKLIPNDSQLTAVLNRLNEKRFALFLKGLEKPPLIRDGYQLADILEKLNEAQRTIVLEALEAQLPQMIKNGFQLAYVLARLTETQRTLFLETLKTQLSQKIQYGFDLANVLENLNETQGTLVLNTLKKELPQLIKDGYQLILVLKNLNKAQSTLVLAAIKDQLPELLIQSYNELVRYLSTEKNQNNRKKIFDVISSYMPEQKKTDLFLSSSLELRQEFYAVIKQNLKQEQKDESAYQELDKFILNKIPQGSTAYTSFFSTTDPHRELSAALWLQSVLFGTVPSFEQKDYEMHQSVLNAPPLQHIIINSNFAQIKNASTESSEIGLPKVK